MAGHSLAGQRHPASIPGPSRASPYVLLDHMGLTTRLERAEQRARVKESWGERQSRAVLTAWLAASDDGAELWLEYGELVATTSCAGDILNSEHGRNIIISIVERIFTLDIQRIPSDYSYHRRRG